MKTLDRYIGRHSANLVVEMYDLWYDGEPRSEGVQSDIGNVDSVDEDCSAGRLDDAEQGECYRRLAGTGASDNSHLKSVNCKKFTFSKFRSIIMIPP